MSAFNRPAILSAGLGLVVGAAPADVINVPGDAATIQIAINAATSGDEIVIAPGTYIETLEINGKVLTLRSTDPADPAVVADTVINVNGLDDRALRIISPGSGRTVIDGLTITGGDAVSAGGGIYIENGDELQVSRCVIEDNVCDNLGGGLSSTGTALVLINACTFRDNRAVIDGADGGGLYINGGTATVSSCVFENNFAAASGSGAGLRFDSVSPAQVTDCTFDGNSVAGNGGAIFIRLGTVLTVDASQFQNNIAVTGAAASVGPDAGSATFRNCSFHGNSAPASGAGGALFNDDELTVLNGTFEGNLQDAVNGTNPPGTVVRNSILWNNGATPVLPGTTVQYSLVQFGYPGTEVLDADPMFVDPAAGDLTLSADSPAIDAGSTSLYCGPMVDLAGAPRGVDGPSPEDASGESVIGPVVDMGAYEFQANPQPACPADLDGDGMVGTTDFLALLAAWGPCP